MPFSSLKPILPVLWLTIGSAASAAPPVWAEDLLGLTGTVTVFDAPVIRQALATDAPPGNLEKLALAAGYRPWAGARLWMLESAEKQKLSPISPDSVLKAELDRRGLVIENTVAPGAVTAFFNLMHGLTADRAPLVAFLASSGIDGVVLVSRTNPLQWQLVMSDATISGSLEPGGRKYLPHIWAENLALQWQWPGLRQASLISIQGIHGFAAFKLAETALGTLCKSTRLLRIEGETVTFACQTGPQAAVPEQTGNLPLQAAPLADHGLDDTILMGRQLCGRTAVYRWQANGSATKVSP